MLLRKKKMVPLAHVVLAGLFALVAAVVLIWVLSWATRPSNSVVVVSQGCCSCCCEGYRYKLGDWDER